MIYRMSPEMSEGLLADTESGMGFQLVRSSGYHYIVLNAVLGLDADEFWSPELSDLEDLEALFADAQWEDALLRTLENANTLSFHQGFAVELADAPTILDQSAGQDAGAESEAGGSFDIENHGSYSRPRPNEQFVRFSAFQTYRRVGGDGSIRANTYATTLVDANVVPSGPAAVGRYALPNPLSARHAFTFGAPTSTTIYCGATTPNFGQAGGGVEVRFSSQLPAGSVTQQHTISER